MLQEEPRVNTSSDGDISEEQLKDPELKPIICILEMGHYQKTLSWLRKL